MRITSTSILSTLVLAAAAASGAEPQWQGLAETLSASHLEDERFVPFSQAPGTFGSPIASRYTWNGEELDANQEAKLAELFEEEFAARLPDGSALRRDPEAERETWVYPVGTRVAHLIRLRTAPPQIFELRVEEKLAEGKWAFGIYVPVATAAGGGPVLALQKYEGLKPDAVDLRLEGGETARLGFKRINLGSCRACHFVNSPAAHQYPTRDEAGPCGFAPGNDDLKTNWAQKYRQAHGKDPFE